MSQYLFLRIQVIVKKKRHIFRYSSITVNLLLSNFIAVNISDIIQDGIPSLALLTVFSKRQPAFHSFPSLDFSSVSS